MTEENTTARRPNMTVRELMDLLRKNVYDRSLPAFAVEDIYGKELAKDKTSVDSEILVIKLVVNTMDAWHKVAGKKGSRYDLAVYGGG